MPSSWTSPSTLIKGSCSHGTEGSPWSHWTKLEQEALEYPISAIQVTFLDFELFFALVSLKNIPVWTRGRCQSWSVRSSRRFIWTINAAMKNSKGREFSVGSCGSDSFYKVPANWGEADVFILHKKAVKWNFDLRLAAICLCSPQLLYIIWCWCSWGSQSPSHRRLRNDSVTVNGKPKLLGTLKCLIWIRNCRNLYSTCCIHARFHFLVLFSVFPTVDVCI